MQTRQHIEKLIRVSQMYYDEGLNQSQIPAGGTFGNLA